MPLPYLFVRTNPWRWPRSTNPYMCSLSIQNLLYAYDAMAYRQDMCSNTLRAGTGYSAGLSSDG
ncbi:hypothetical protein D0Z07_1716 [Hyphodiscus hymeniophilus]|uniref:Uncharacterized protein n=1 Tax=Hyphodiscus hymeniophilus TaxID=353542 RepID=A0A9P6VMV3_9HELO|nr:hypothetical protein D0Z07_1716 [Hyphodiscus hymeniophilus]